MGEVIDYNELKMHIEYLDLCLCDYFRGHGGTHYAIPVDWRTTLGDIKEELRNQWNNDCGFAADLEQYDEYWLSLQFNAALDDFIAGKGRIPTAALRAAIKGLEKAEEDAESVYLYLAIVVD